MNIDRNLRTRTRLLLALPIAVAAFSLAACSSPAERPSSDDLSSGIQKILDDGGLGDQFNDEQVSCISDELIDSKISDQDLQNIADGKDVQTNQEAKDLVSKEMSEAVVTCAQG
ncbi:hypothetical protein FM104_15105 [Microbacterium esteraromaticum]|uniref:Secreted protein n=1 Tax=Microbacterium esteraromaticum TaxID=57043 RepID=A0A1R4KQF4_9MICO|nr:hypothetical protein [Microbacterium esteraromaticum]SJN46626.1 hypothetical protein FM104_15105 [Microbacterium esteraromaticum]